MDASHREGCIPRALPLSELRVQGQISKRVSLVGLDLRSCQFGQFLFDCLNAGEAVLMLLPIGPNYIQSASAMVLIRCKEVGKFLAEGSGFQQHFLIGHHAICALPN